MMNSFTLATSPITSILVMAYSSNKISISTMESGVMARGPAKVKNAIWKILTALFMTVNGLIISHMVRADGLMMTVAGMKIPGTRTNQARSLGIQLYLHTLPATVSTDVTFLVAAK